VDKNTQLKEMGKFSYLMRNLTGLAYDAINGYSIVKDHYEPPKAELKRRFGLNDTIQADHYSALASTTAVGDRRDIIGLRKFHDDVRAHILCLAATGANEETYAGILKPTLLQTLPNALVVDWHREKDHQTKNVSYLLLFICTELESRKDAAMLRKESGQSKQSRQTPQQQSGYRQEGGRSRYQYHNESYDVLGNRPSTSTQLVVGPARIILRLDH